MSEYKGLHSAEQTKLREAGRNMKDALNDLDNALTRVGFRYTNYGRYFQGAREKMTVIYKELCEEHRYIDDIDRYNIGRKELDDGKTLMFNAQEEMKRAGDYKYLLDRVEVCRVWTTKYAQAWSEIRAFDRKNGKKNAYAQRLIGNHAFNPTARADMGEMREMLRELGAESMRARIS